MWGNRAFDHCCCRRYTVDSSLLHPEFWLLQEHHHCQHRGAGAVCAAEQELLWWRGQPPEHQSFTHQRPPAWGETPHTSAWTQQWRKWDWGVWSEKAGGGLCHHVQFLSDQVGQGLGGRRVTVIDRQIVQTSENSSSGCSKSVVPNLGVRTPKKRGHKMILDKKERKHKYTFCSMDGNVSQSTVLVKMKIT